MGQARRAKRSSPAGGKAARKRRILLVESRVRDRREMLRVLAQVGAVDVAKTLAEARKRMRRHAYVGAVIDTGRPDGSGLDFLSWAREQGWRGAALIVSGAADRALPGRAVVLNAQFAYKPVSPEVLGTFASRAIEGAALTGLVREVAEERKLSPRQTVLLLRFAHGTRRSELARALDLAEFTIKTMVREILRKTGTRKLEEIAIKLLRRATYDEG